MRIADLQTLDDDALGQLLAESFADLPEADPARLALIRDRLPQPHQQKTVNKRWLHIITIGILTGSGFVAAWWGIDKLFHSESASPPAAELHTAPLADQPSSPQVDDQHETVKQGDDRKSPIIFQQERY